MVEPPYAKMKQKKWADKNAQERTAFKLFRLLCDQPHIPPPTFIPSIAPAWSSAEIMT